LRQAVAFEPNLLKILSIRKIRRMQWRNRRAGTVRSGASWCCRFVASPGPIVGIVANLWLTMIAKANVKSAAAAENQALAKG
jgi:hypothetical protein